MSRQYPGRKHVEAAVRPLLMPIVQRWAGHRVTRLLGFWVVWHTYGSVRAIVDAGLYPRQTVYRMRSEFEQTFGMPVDDWDPELAAQIAARREDAPS